MQNKSQFDFTMMSTFLTCRRKYDFRMNKGYVRKVEQTAPQFGKAIHLALDSWYVDKLVDKAIDVFKANYKDNLELDDKRTVKLGEWIINNYHQRYVDQPWELVANEQEFKILLPNNNFFIGRIDKIIKWDSCLWIVDHKTTSSLGSTYFNMAEPNMQFVGYAWAMKQLGFDVKGVIIDALLVAKGLLPGTSKNNNLTPLARYDIYYKQENYNEWLATIESIQQDIRMNEEYEQEGENTWYPNFTACTNFVECPYRRVCKEDKEIRQRILDADFVIEPWEPIKKDE